MEVSFRLAEQAKENAMEQERRDFVYEEAESLSSLDLTEESQHIPDAQFYIVTLVKPDGYLATNSERVDVLYSPELGRMGIAWGADATWADVEGVEQGINMWLNEPDEWAQRN